MRYKTFLGILTTFLSLNVFADKKASPSLLIIGDSWAKMMCDQKSFYNPIAKEKMTLTVLSDCKDTTKYGLKAFQWFNSEIEQNTRQIISEKKPDIVYLSLGGNDMGQWNKNMSSAEQQKLFDTISENLVAIANSIISISPNSQIILSGYDYFRLQKNNSVKRYDELYKSFGEPTTLELHQAFINLSKNILEHLQKFSTKRIKYIHHYGVLHYYFGIPDANIKPYTTLHPNQISNTTNPVSYGGLITEHAATSSQLSIVFWTDSYHPNKIGFEYIAEHALKNIIIPTLESEYIYF